MAPWSRLFAPRVIQRNSSGIAPAVIAYISSVMFLPINEKECDPLYRIYINGSIKKPEAILNERI